MSEIAPLNGLFISVTSGVRGMSIYYTSIHLVVKMTLALVSFLEHTANDNFQRRGIIGLMNCL